MRSGRTGTWNHCVDPRASWPKKVRRKFHDVSDRKERRSRSAVPAMDAFPRSPTKSGAAAEMADAAPKMAAVPGDYRRLRFGHGLLEHAAACQLIESLR